MNDKVSSRDKTMDYSFFDNIQTLSQFWEKHHYCLSSDCIQKGIRFLATSTEKFRSRYSCYYLTKILNAFCQFDARIQSIDMQTPHKREICFRLFKTSAKENSALGLAVVLKVKSNTEFLSKERLLRAILHIIPGVVAVPDMTYQYRDEEKDLLFLYQEIEKKRGRGFLASDIQQLKKLLLTELEESITFYSPSLFLIRNEEEIFRNVVQMSKELSKPLDLPQVTISFQEQTLKGSLLFSVVVVRPVTKLTPSLKQLSASLPQTIQYIPEMTSDIGVIDTKFSKQANIVTFELESGSFARKNGAIDLREARSYIAKALELMIGEYRDYNGGLFSKQNKHLKDIQEMLGGENKLLLESLFYSFTPSLFQTFILPEAGKACATLFLEAKNHPLTSQKTHALFKHSEKTFSLIVIKTSKEQIKNVILKEIANFSFPLHQFGYTVHRINNEHYLGLIYQYPTKPFLFESIEALVQQPQDLPKQSKKLLRINFQDGDPLSLNPQIGLDLRCRSVQKALFEGLTRISPNGSTELAAAKRVEVLDNGKTYLFSLKKLQWSNGEELTAFQFEKSWKKAIASPACLRPDIFYIIQNARKARFNQVSMDAVGVTALDKRTLRVSLEYPAPYFLQMLTHPLFVPLYEESGEPYVFSGPFTLHRWNHDHSLTLIKNPYYWDFENVKLDGIEISIICDPYLAYQKYEKGELDWIGGPFSLLPIGIASQLTQDLKRVDTPGVSWIYCNLTHPLVSSAKIRRALSFVLDRNKICEKTLLNPSPLSTHLPNSLSLLSDSDIHQPDETKNALELFEQGLQETAYSRKQLEPLMLFHSHIPGQKELAIEVQKQWQDAFGIKIGRVEETLNTFSHQLDNRLFHFGTCFRHPFYFDPMYFFQIFYDAHNIHNAFGWQHEGFNHWIQQARLFPEDQSFLKLAEKELLNQMPVIPLHMVTYHYLARDKVKGIHFCHSGDVDFKSIYFEDTA